MVQSICVIRWEVCWQLALLSSLFTVTMAFLASLDGPTSGRLAIRRYIRTGYIAQYKVVCASWSCLRRTAQYCAVLAIMMAGTVKMRWQPLRCSLTPPMLCRMQLISRQVAAEEGGTELSQLLLRRVR